MAHDWGLSRELQLKTTVTDYHVPNISSLYTVSKQHSALSLLRKHTSKWYADLNEEQYCILAIINSVTNPKFCNSAQNNLLFTNLPHCKTNPPIGPNIFHLLLNS